MNEDENRDAQTDEILALQSIYNSNELKMKSETQGTFYAHVQPQTETIDLILDSDSALPKSLKHLCKRCGDRVSYSLRHLPPVAMHFEYPSTYPSDSPPKVSLSCVWLTSEEIARLRLYLLDEWESMRDVILFSWTSFLTEETWSFLDLPSEITCPGTFPVEIVPNICAFDFDRRSYVFSQSPHKCNVCFEEFKGSLCLQFLPCDHVYCKICMKGYFEVLINSGDVSKMECPSHNCESIALPTQIKTLVDHDLYEKYERFLLQRTLDQMSDVARCPRKFCHNSVLKESDSNMAQCNSCHFVFCAMCEKTWHGAHTPCLLENARFREIYEKWSSGSDPEREALYKMYSKNRVMNIVADMDSAEFLKENSKPCPGCFTPIQLGMGCNKVQCAACKKTFCWLCGKAINMKDPYAHFRPGGPCENRLFEGTQQFEVADVLAEFQEEDDWIVFQ